MFNSIIVSGTPWRPRRCPTAVVIRSLSPLCCRLYLSCVCYRCCYFVWQLYAMFDIVHLYISCLCVCVCVCQFVCFAEYAAMAEKMSYRGCICCHCFNNHVVRLVVMYCLFVNMLLDCEFQITGVIIHHVVFLMLLFVSCSLYVYYYCNSG